MIFKVGDKVRVYGGINRNPKERWCRLYPLAYLRGEEAKVVSIVQEDSEILVKFSDGYVTEAHPKQCRKIRKVKK